MKFLFSLLICLSFVAAALSAVAVGNFASSKYPGKCYISKDLILTPGEHKHPDSCMQIHCSADGSASMIGCGVQHIGGCEPGPLANKHAKHPDCCRQKFFCKQPNGRIKTIIV